MKLVYVIAEIIENGEEKQVKLDRAYWDKTEADAYADTQNLLLKAFSKKARYQVFPVNPKDTIME